MKVTTKIPSMATAMKPNILFRQRGASLLEGIAYLGVAAIVILGAISLLTSAFSGAQSNRAAEEVLAIRTAIKKLYQGNYPAGAGDMATDLKTAKALPGTLVFGAGAAITNGWGGDVILASPSAGSYSIEYRLVPQEGCINLISGSSGWTTVKVGARPAVTPPITGSQAVDECVGATNTIIWTGQ